MTADTGPLRRISVFGMVFGLAYGVVGRSVVEQKAMAGLFGAMTLSFLTLVPLVMGYFTVRGHPDPSVRYRLIAPWVPIILSVLVSWAVGWEGTLCIVMALPLLLIMGSIGGLLGGWARLRPRTPAGAFLLLPWLVGPLEHRWIPPATEREVTTVITIHAPAAVVWDNVIEVPTIQASELRPALFTTMGFPRPISATLDGSGVGATRHARFAGGVLFLETVTDWVPERRLSFSIRAQTDSIPPSTLDRHVTIGGEYFDALSGSYELEPAPDGEIRLVLRSRHRLSTRFNLYAGLWSDAIMRSIQRNILEVLAIRCEGDARLQRPGHGATGTATPHYEGTPREAS